LSAFLVAANTLLHCLLSGYDQQYHFARAGGADGENKCGAIIISANNGAAETFAHTTFEKTR